jgi:hypothetical protein
MVGGGGGLILLGDTDTGRRPEIRRVQILSGAETWIFVSFLCHQTSKSQTDLTLNQHRYKHLLVIFSRKTEAFFKPF